MSYGNMTSDITKSSIRQKIWQYLEHNNLAQFPRPVFNRIPNFKGAEAACDKIKDLEEFKKAQVVKINPDKPQQQARYLTLEAHKTLLVPTPRLRSGLFNAIVPPPAANKHQLRICSSSEGVKNFSVPITLDSQIKVDAIIIGSVAVSFSGHRIGKGEGYADMEYAMMTSMGAITPDTPVITTVHDCQVLESIPEELFGEHDVPVDIIVTSTRVIRCQPRLPKPKGIIWSLLTEEKLREIPILTTLRDKERTMPSKNICLEELSLDVTKESIRQKIWNYLTDNDLAEFPRPVFNRIPNFKGAEAACEKLKELEVFQNAQIVKVSPDKPQQHARFLTLQAHKELVVSAPRLKSNLLNKICSLPYATDAELKRYSSSEGLKKFSIPISGEVKLDAVIIGAVAVSESGYRIGKGEGYADMGYAIMMTMGVINPSTPVIATVHDCQVFKDLPKELFGEHDVPVNIIVTPTRIIRCTPVASKPRGIIWSLLTEKKLNEIPMLKTLYNSNKINIR